MNATEQFNERIKSTFEKLDVLKSLTEQLKQEQAQYPFSRYRITSIGYVNEELDKIIEFLICK